MRQEDIGTYQMLWDCPACGTGKLLGIDHRHCPNCGSPQDPNMRYYPSEEDKVLIAHHRFVGADKVCPGCSTPTSAASQFCAGCGAPLERDAKDAAARSDQVAQGPIGFLGESVQQAKDEMRARRQAVVDQAAGRTPEKRKSNTGLKVGLIVGGIVAVLATLVFVLFFWKKEAFVEVDGHSWKRTIAVERYDDVTESAWCDSVPRTAKIKNRSKAVKSHKQVKDGETCTKRRKDNRDGTFKEVKECKPKFRDEPVYADKCTFEVTKWHQVRVEEASGRDREPAWPTVELRKKGACKGCERTGDKNAVYTLHLVDKVGNETYDCNFEESTWKSTEPGAKFRAEVGVVTTSLDCDSFKPVP